MSLSKWMVGGGGITPSHMVELHDMRFAACMYVGLLEDGRPGTKAARKVTTVNNSSSGRYA